MGTGAVSDSCTRLWDPRSPWPALIHGEVLSASNAAAVTAQGH